MPTELPRHSLTHCSASGLLCCFTWNGEMELCCAQDGGRSESISYWCCRAATVTHQPGLSWRSLVKNQRREDRLISLWVIKSFGASGATVCELPVGRLIWEHAGRWAGRKEKDREGKKEGKGKEGRREGGREGREERKGGRKEKRKGGRKRKEGGDGKLPS